MARSNRISGKGGSLLDSGVALLAALSGGFVTYAMPEGLFSRIVVASHLPQFLAAAQPPLGMKARLAVVAVAVLVIYAFVWTLLRALDSVGGRKRAAVIVPEALEEEETPRLRRADAHPDAPSRRPIFAGRDLGEPEFEEAEFEEAPLELETAIAPEPEPEVAFEPEFEPEIAVAPEAEVESLPAFLVPQQHEPEPEPVEQPAPEVFAEPNFDAHFDEFGQPAEEVEEEAEEEPETLESDGDDQSLARLMQRFESGLGRKQQALDAPPPAAVVPEPEPMPVPQERVGHRLRSAISDLNKMSGSGR